MDRARVFAALNDADVRFVIVGGLAVIAHGHARLTVGIDVVIDLAPDPARRALDALVGLGLEPRLPVDARQFAEAAVREEWIRDKGMRVFTLLDPSDPLFEMDLFVESPLDFEQLFADAKVDSIGNVQVRVASIGHLIAMKLRAGRAKDLEDIEELKALRDD